MDIKSALIVDDSKMARITLKKQLESKNISVFLAESGEESIDFLNNNHPDLIFMDCLMPGIDGFEATKQILSNSDTSDIPIVMCTGKESEEDKQKAFQLGAAGYMTKSSSADPLNAILNELQTIEIETTEPAEQETTSETASVRVDDINQIVEQTAIRIVEQISQKVASSIAETVAQSVAEKVAQEQISVLNSQHSAKLDEKISILTNELENKVVYSVKSSLEDVHQSLEKVHSYIDTKIDSIDQVNLPELKESISKPLTDTIKSSNEQLQQEVNQLKTELTDLDLNNIIDQTFEQNLQNHLPSQFSSLLENETSKNYIESVIQSRLTAHKSSNTLGLFALMVGTGGLFLSAYLFFQ